VGDESGIELRCRDVAVVIRVYQLVKAIQQVVSQTGTGPGGDGRGLGVCVHEQAKRKDQKNDKSHFLFFF